MMYKSEVRHAKKKSAEVVVEGYVVRKKLVE